MESTLPAAVVMTATDTSAGTVGHSHGEAKAQSLAVITAKNFVSGTVAGVCEAVVGYPLETIKARMQTESAQAFSGPIDCLQKSVREGGVASLYRGASPQIFRSAVRCVCHSRAQMLL